MNPTKVEDFCKTALKRILMNSGETPKISPAELNDALYEYNLIRDSWNADGAMILSLRFFTFPLVTGQQVYTIGANTVVNGNTVVADFNTGSQPRPTYLEFASYQQTINSPVADLPMRIVNADEWASIVTKNIAAGVSFYVYMDEDYPHAHLHIWPLPSVTGNIVLTVPLAMSSTLTLNDAHSMAPGYEKALSLSLSIAMAPYYGKSGEPAIAQLSSQLSKIESDIGWNNLRGGALHYSSDAQSASGSGGTYDATTDQIL
jgi:hypothetical protein